MSDGSPPPLLPAASELSPVDTPPPPTPLVLERGSGTTPPPSPLFAQARPIISLPLVAHPPKGMVKGCQMSSKGACARGDCEKGSISQQHLGGWVSSFFFSFITIPSLCPNLFVRTSSVVTAIRFMVCLFVGLCGGGGVRISPFHRVHVSR